MSFNLDNKPDFKSRFSLGDKQKADKTTPVDNKQKPNDDDKSSLPLGKVLTALGVTAFAGSICAFGISPNNASAYLTSGVQLMLMKVGLGTSGNSYEDKVTEEQLSSSNNLAKQGYLMHLCKYSPKMREMYTEQVVKNSGKLKGYSNDFLKEEGVKFPGNYRKQINNLHLEKDLYNPKYINWDSVKKSNVKLPKKPVDPNS